MKIQALGSPCTHRITWVLQFPPLSFTSMLLNSKGNLQNSHPYTQRAKCLERPSTELLEVKMAKSNTHYEHWPSNKAGLGWLELPRYLVLVGGWPLHTLLRHLEFLLCCWTRLGQLKFPELAAASFTNFLHSCQTAAYLQLMNNLCWASQELHRILRYSTLLPWNLINLTTTIRNARITVAEQSSSHLLKDCLSVPLGHCSMSKIVIPVVSLRKE